jgi:hypothetical protein
MPRPPTVISWPNSKRSRTVEGGEERRRVGGIAGEYSTPTGRSAGRIALDSLGSAPLKSKLFETFANTTVELTNCSRPGSLPLTLYLKMPRRYTIERLM